MRSIGLVWFTLIPATSFRARTRFLPRLASMSLGFPAKRRRVSLAGLGAVKDETWKGRGKQ